MGFISINVPSSARAAALFGACASAALTFTSFAPPAGAEALKHLTSTRVAETSSGSCPPDTMASLAQPVVADKPEIARDMRASGTAILRVDLSSTGTLVGTSVMTSTRNWWLDHAAIVAIRQARFQPELRACRQVAGSYLVDVIFTED